MFETVNVQRSHCRRSYGSRHSSLRQREEPVAQGQDRILDELGHCDSQGDATAKVHGDVDLIRHPKAKRLQQERDDPKRLGGLLASRTIGCARFSKSSRGGRTRGKGPDVLSEDPTQHAIQ